MKKLILLLLLAASITLAGYSQGTNTITNPSAPSWLQIGGTDVADFFSHANIKYATYLIYDSTTKKVGAGVGFGYNVNDFLVSVIRLDEINGGVFVPSGSLQLQAPITIKGFIVIPLAFSGIATSLNNKKNGDNGNVVGIFGSGVAIRLPASTKWYIPKDIIVDYEKWTGGGFNDNQYRGGFVWMF